MGKFLNDFKQFAMRGNVLDMAVGVIIGGAFGKLPLIMVTSSKPPRLPHRGILRVHAD